MCSRQLPHGDWGRSVQKEVTLQFWSLFTLHRSVRHGRPTDPPALCRRRSLGIAKHFFLHHCSAGHDGRALVQVLMQVGEFQKIPILAIMELVMDSRKRENICSNPPRVQVRKMVTTWISWKMSTFYSSNWRVKRDFDKKGESFWVAFIAFSRL